MTIVNTSTRKTDLPASLVTRLDEVRRREASLGLTAGLIDALSPVPGRPVFRTRD